MIFNILLLIIGFIILIKSADVFVDSASDIASYFKISKMIIGLTIVAFGTSAPEFAVSVKSMMSGSKDIVLGNVIGSNILNILLILGLSSLFHPLTVKSNTVKKEIPITMLITSLLIVLMSDKLFQPGLKNTLSRGDGISILLFFLIFIYYLVNQMRNKKETEENETKKNLLISIILTVLGIVGIVLGSNFVVNSSSYLAKAFGVSEKMIALTIVALGTSLPELVTSVIATKKGSYDIAIGNIVGSNIFNIGVVLGIPLSIFGGMSNYTINVIDLLTLFIATTLLFIFAYTNKKINKVEGFFFLLIFVVYYSYVVFA